MNIENTELLHTDVLIIGGGTAGCYAALTVRENSDYKIIIAEKANIKRSGCLAAGVNAINAYIVKGRKPEDYVDYAKKDADNIVREDLLLTMSEGLNRVTAKMEQLGLVILKDEDGEYVARGNRNIKINGENMKPLLASAVEALPDVTILNRVNITDYLIEDNEIKGAIVSLQRRAINRISNVVISAPPRIPIANPAPVLNGGYHILCLENPGLFGRYRPAAPPVAQSTFFARIT